MVEICQTHYSFIFPTTQAHPGYFYLHFYSNPTKKTISRLGVSSWTQDKTCTTPPPPPPPPWHVNLPCTTDGTFFVEHSFHCPETGESDREVEKESHCERDARIPKKEIRVISEYVIHFDVVWVLFLFLD